MSNNTIFNIQSLLFQKLNQCWSIKCTEDEFNIGYAQKEKRIIMYTKFFQYKQNMHNVLPYILNIQKNTHNLILIFPKKKSLFNNKFTSNTPKLLIKNYITASTCKD